MRRRITLCALLVFLLPAVASGQQAAKQKCEEELAAFVKMAGSFFHAAELSAQAQAREAFLVKENERLKAELAARAPGAAPSKPAAPSTPPAPSTPLAPGAGTGQ